MVEFKIDRDGIPFLMEINGRLWGSLQLAIDAGVDFPAMLVRLALGSEVEPRLSYSSDVRTRWEWGDVDHLVSRLRRTSRALSLPAGSPGRWRVLLDFLGTFASDARSEVFNWDDPRPFFRETVQWLKLGS